MAGAGPDCHRLATPALRDTADLRGTVTDTATTLAEPADSGQTLSAPAVPPDAVADGAAPWLAVEGFDGPLDLLLTLARAQQIDLARLSIAALIWGVCDALP